MGGGPDPVDNVEEREWGLFVDFSRPGPDDSNPSPARRQLREKWARNRFIVMFIAGAGWLGRGPKKKGPLGRRVGGVALDPLSVLKAEYQATQAAIDEKFDRAVERWPESGEDLGDLIRQNSAEHEAARRDYRQKRNTFDPDYEARVVEDVKDEIAEHRARIGQLESERASLQAQLALLNESDGRDDAAKAGQEPPHPPYKKIHETEQSLLRLQEEVGLEKRLLKAREADLVLLEKER